LGRRRSSLAGGQGAGAGIENVIRLRAHPNPRLKPSVDRCKSVVQQDPAAQPDTVLRLLRWQWNSMQPLEDQLGMAFADTRLAARSHEIVNLPDLRQQTEKLTGDTYAISRFCPGMSVFALFVCEQRATGTAEQARPIFAEQSSPLEIATSIFAVRQADRNVDHRSDERAIEALFQIDQEIDLFGSVAGEPDAYPAFRISVQPNEHRLT
jgi:hypothetical protein